LKQRVRCISYSYLGLTDNVRDEEWVWDESDTPMEYSNWMEDQPDNVGEDHCVLLCGPEFEWCNDDCYSKYTPPPIYIYMYALCEAPNT
jgi:hypothetical protein